MNIRTLAISANN